MLLRARISRLLPPWLKLAVRPVLVGALYRIEQRRMERLYAGFVNPGDLVFDIGAAEGYVSEVFLRLGARVVSAEPQDYCLRRLRRRLGQHPLLSVVTHGVGGVAGTQTLWCAPGDPEIATFALDKWQRGRYRAFRFTRSVEVPITTLDELIAGHGVPQFCKIDVEGMEPAVLQGLTQTLPALSFEFTQECLDDVRACGQRLERLGRMRFNYSLYRRYALELSPWLDTVDELVEALLAHQDPGLVGDVFAVASRR